MHMHAYRSGRTVQLSSLVALLQGLLSGFAKVVLELDLVLQHIGKLNKLTALQVISTCLEKDLAP